VHLLERNVSVMFVQLTYSLNVVLSTVVELVTVYYSLSVLYGNLDCYQVCCLRFPLFCDSHCFVLQFLSCSD